jgi:D-glucosaminate-6-phosphate ammonia-lyase
MGVYHELGLEPIINVSGSVTRLGGAPMSTAVLEAFRAATEDCVPLEALHGAACREIAGITGAEAGLVTAGAAAALTLGTAAILARDDLGRMERLPQCNGFPREFVIAREQRNGYDHAVRAAGATLVEVGMNEIIAGSGVRRTEAWEYSAAFGPDTAGVLYVHDAAARPSLVEVVAEAHAAGLPVLVDAAGELPPRANLRAILASGADLVCFSGGKAIRGPQATGILCGRRDLVGSAALQMLDMDDHLELWDPPPELIDRAKFRGLPRHGIGRAMKVSKEQIVALLTALKLFASGGYAAELLGMRNHLGKVAAALEGRPVRCRIIIPPDGESSPLLEIVIEEAVLGRSALEVCRRLRRGTPPVYPGHGMLHESKLVINPLHLTDERTRLLIGRLREELTPDSPTTP